MARYECTLSPELLDRAVNELHEPRDNNERLKAIDELRSSYNADKFGPLYNEDDAFLLRFLRAKKFNQKKALNVLQNYHTAKRDYKEIFDKVNNPTLMRTMLDTNVMLILKDPAKDGSAIMYYRPGMIKGEYDLYDLMAVGVIMLEKLLEDEKNQICGMRSIEDMDGFNISLLFKISPSAMKKMNSIWQDGMPIRFKAVHLINEGKIYDIIMGIMKAFVSKKIMDRIHTHGSRFEEIHEFVDPSVLPPCLRGTGPTPEETAEYLSRLLDSEDTKL